MASFSQDGDFSLTTLTAVTLVSYHPITPVKNLMTDIKPVVVQPQRTVDVYRCTGASKIHIFANDLLCHMVLINIFSDTVAIRDEDVDSSKWTQQTQEKCGICHGSFFIVEGPLEKATEFDQIEEDWKHDMDHFMDNKLKETAKVLPGRSFFVIHERNFTRFQKIYDEKRSVFVLKKNGRFELEKNVVTGFYQVDIFG